MCHVSCILWILRQISDKQSWLQSASIYFKSRKDQSPFHVIFSAAVLSIFHTHLLFWFSSPDSVALGWLYGLTWVKTPVKSPGLVHFLPQAAATCSVYLVCCANFPVNWHFQFYCICTIMLFCFFSLLGKCFFLLYLTFVLFICTLYENENDAFFVGVVLCEHTVKSESAYQKSMRVLLFWICCALF